MPNIFQTEEWARFKTQTGYQKYYNFDGVFVLQKQLPLGRTMLYSPMVDVNNELRIMDNGFLDKITEIAKQNKSIFYRLEISNSIIHNSSFTIPQNFVKSFEEMQPEHTMILNIKKRKEDILAGMKQKGRYNIKIAQKHNVQIRKSRQIDNFYKLYEETAMRQKITYRNKEYFHALLDNLEPKGYCELFEAITTQTNADLTPTNAELTQKDNYHPEQSEGSQQFSNLAMSEEAKPTSDSNETMKQCDNEIVLAAAIVSFYKGRATYLFGASSNEMRNVMAPYLLHWYIISEAKRRNIAEYDWFGIAPNDNPRHPWAGVTRFKRQFGGNQIQLMGSWDLVMRPVEYQIFKIAEKLRRR